MSDVTIFAPSPTLTVTVEDHPQGSEIHVHAGGQGVWQARMLRRLDVSVTVCCVLTGEVGQVMRHLLEDEGFRVVAIEREGRGSAYLHDRRGGERMPIAEEEGDPIGRHELDDLYGAVLETSAESSVVLLSGPAGEEAVPSDVYRRLATDLRRDGRTVMADLAGDRLAAVVAGRADVIKVSHEELIDGGLAADSSVAALVSAMRELHRRGAGSVIVTRAADPLLLLDEDGIAEVAPPRLEENETRGAGDSLTAGVAAGLVRGGTVREAITLGAAAGALNVTRHGLGTGDAAAILRLREDVDVRELRLPEGEDAEAGAVSPDQLAALADPTPPTARPRSERPAPAEQERSEGS